MDAVIGARLDLFRDGVASLARARAPLILALTASIWTCEAFALWTVFQALGVSLSPAGVGLVLGCGALSTLLPNAPGFIGTLQFAFFTATAALGLDGHAGAAAATLVQACLFLPTTVAGLAWAATAGDSLFRYASLDRAAPG
jgi:uncharacterized membrane protein YbhN (UPF0104 family)